MFENFIVYDKASGKELWRGSRPAGTGISRPLPDGAGILFVPQEVMEQIEIDLDALRTALSEGVDNAAERTRARYVTALPAQVGIYLLKANAIRRWLADRTASTAMFQPEANSRGMTLEALADEVLALEAQWEIIGGEIEGLRFGAKRAIAEATTIGAIAQAAMVDWTVLDASAS